MAVVRDGEILDSNPRPPATPEGVPQGMNFFEWLFQLGIGLEGDWTKYATGEGLSEPDYSNLFNIVTREINALPTDNPVREQYYQFLKLSGIDIGDTTYYSSGQANKDAGAIDNLIKVATGHFTANPGGTTPDQPSTTPGEGPTGIMSGGQTVRVNVEGGQRYYQVYEFPAGSGNMVAFQFNDLNQVESALGKNFDVVTRPESWFNQNVLAEGAAEEVIGQTTSNWQVFTRDLMRDAATAAGVRDPALAGRIANNPEMQAIMVQSMLGDWTESQIKAEQRKTNFWQNELYPGIANFYGRTENPEVAWATYEQQVRNSLQALGYQRDASGSYAQTIGEMLNAGINAEDFVSLTPVYQRAVQNAEFADTLNVWAEQRLGRNIEFNDWFDLMAGESRPELEQVAEEATLAWQAQNEGINLTQQQIGDLAARTQMSLAEAAAAFGEFNRGILAVGEQGLAKYDLTPDDVLSAAAGVAGQSGRSVEEVKRSVAKIAREQALFDDEKINFYVGFTPQGTPNRPGLTSLAPEGA